MFVHGELFFGLDMYIARSEADIDFLITLCSVLDRHKSASFVESAGVDFDFLTLDGWCLNAPPQRTPRGQRPRLEMVMHCRGAPIWSSWCPIDDEEAMGCLPALPELFMRSGLLCPPVLPPVFDYVFNRLQDTGHVAWTPVYTEYVVDAVAVWFYHVRVKKSQGRLKPELLEVFSRLPVNGLQTGSEEGRAVAFYRVLEAPGRSPGPP